MSGLSLTFRRLLTFVLLYGVILVSSFYISHSKVFESNPKLAWAVLFDLTLVPAALFFILVARTKTFTKLRIALIYASILRIAFFIIPSKSSLPTINWTFFLILTEVFALSIIVFRLRSILKTFQQFRVSQNFDDALRESFVLVLGPIFAGIVLTEIRLIHYSLFGWLVKSDITATEKAATSYKKSGQIALLTAILIVALIETAGMHFLILKWSKPLGYAVTALSLYSLLYILAEITALRKRPSFISRNLIKVRLGMRWHATIQMNEIEGISKISEKPAKSPTTLNGSLLVTPNILITFKQPVSIYGPYGIKRQINQLALFIDNETELLESWGNISY